MLFVRLGLIFLSLFWISNCGGAGTGISIVSVTPTEPFVLNSVRNIAFTIDEFVTLEPPNTQFQIRINNTGEDANRPITIIAASLTVSGPKGTKRIDLDPLTSLVNINTSTGSFNLVSRAYFAEIPPYQASYCLSKIDDFRRADNTESCTTIANDDVAINIPQYGVSATNLEDDTGNNSVCCPTGIRSMANLFILAPKIQDFAQGETIPVGQTYNATLDVVGFYGTFANPTANFFTSVPFSMRSF
jgi:hypothetical protein